MSLPLAGCAEQEAASDAPASGLAAPTWEMTGPGGEFSLADAAGRPVVLQFGTDDPETWRALEEAHLDLEAAGAIVVGAVTEGSPVGLHLPFATVADPDAAVAETYGYTGRPLVVVIDAEGRLRSRSESVETVDQFFDLAASALLEAEDVDAPLAQAADTHEPIALAPEAVGDMVREGAALLDLRPETDLQRDGAIPFALVCPLADFSPDVLPVNALVPVILAGPDAPAAAIQAIEWGFQSVYVVENAGPLADPNAERFTAPEAEPPPSRLPNKRRAIG